MQAILDAGADTIAKAWSAPFSRCWSKGPRRKQPLELVARTSNNWVVNFPGPQRLVGQIIDVHIIAAMAHTLRAEVLVREPA